MPRFEASIIGMAEPRGPKCPRANTHLNRSTPSVCACGSLASPQATSPHTQRSFSISLAYTRAPLSLQLVTSCFTIETPPPRTCGWLSHWSPKPSSPTTHPNSASSHSYSVPLRVPRHADLGSTGMVSLIQAASRLPDLSSLSLRSVLPSLACFCDLCGKLHLHCRGPRRSTRVLA
jgi:hypothetical protein